MRFPQAWPQSKLVSSDESSIIEDATSLFSRTSPSARHAYPLRVARRVSKSPEFTIQRRRFDFAPPVHPARIEAVILEAGRISNIRARVNIYPPASDPIKFSTRQFSRSPSPGARLRLTASSLIVRPSFYLPSVAEIISLLAAKEHSRARLVLKIKKKTKLYHKIRLSVRRRFNSRVFRLVRGSKDSHYLKRDRYL